MIFFPSAKINIGLHILHKRIDGFHEVETLLYPIPLLDCVEWVPSDKTSIEVFTKSTTKPFQISRNSLLEREDNLVLRAYDLLKKDFDLPALSFYLYKNIPIGAGLGGGSSDGAYVLKHLNKAFSLHLSYDILHQYASQLGTDMAFFLEPQATFATGKGEVLSPFPLNIEGVYGVIIKPPVSISTAEAYQRVKPRTPKTSLREALQKPMDQWKYHLINDFEETIFLHYPMLETIKNTLYDLGAIYASMSGSGSAFYAFFKDFTDLSALEDENRIFYWNLL